MGKVEFRTVVEAELLQAARDAGVGLSDAVEAGLRLAIEQAQKNGSDSDFVAATRRQRQIRPQPRNVRANGRKRTRRQSKPTTNASPRAVCSARTCEGGDLRQF